MAITIEPALDPTVEHARVLVTWGPGEEDVRRLLAPLGVADAGVHVEVLPGTGPEGRLRLSGADRERLTWAIGVVRAGLGDAVLGEDGVTLESAVVELLQRQGLCLGTAESLTSGLLAARLSEPPGASEVFRGGVVAYASDVKHEVLDVREGPVVTAEAAMEMAEGAAHVLDVSIAVALTGVAGPAPMEDMPVGTVFVGSWLDGEARAERLSLSGDRERIRHDSASHALDHVRRRLLARQRSRLHRN